MAPAIHTTHQVFVLDCPDAVELAKFYAGLLDWQLEQTEGDDDWVKLRPTGSGNSGFHLAFQKIENYVAPTWPEGPTPQQCHLDFYVRSLTESEPLAIAAGAAMHPVQPGKDDGFTVFADPAGHLFCLCEH